mmetsp:Transcript_14804/g.23141  ORF Transcript_14804/g.23141 Transcript_14804/m.23141 type:complete len:710 (-) Transcript_14804:1309-3438(-)|eukprot:CAMPEP_0201539930 /NCGR_PEP_ID=MMETSP0161_2-20130828/70665_1 /ASSEMBLY_ACC=CAM_ASM_000251 /TAXON_ID=180227 /ORGANISM="Neoparamoeba aestuarina, Strain SoJaBio B1-5/56/2" /LENGTH=709 /DNA_ID=CAMNT_0047947357 /DNA_START=134 /DNA_END=2263 /DNA_ORIENTATION=-
MAAYPGGEMGAGKMTIAFRGYNQSLQESADQGATPGGSLVDGAKVIDTLGQHTRVVHISCNTLFQNARAQSEFYVIPGEPQRKQCLAVAQQASEAANKLYQLMEPHSAEQAFILLSEKFKLLVPAVVKFLRCITFLLFKLNCSPSAQQMQEATDLFNGLRVHLRGAVEQIKSIQHNPPILGMGASINFQEFIALCKETKAMQNRISAIASRSDPEVSHDPPRAEELFIELAGQFVSNIKMIIRFCGAREMSVQEETLVDQSNRLINSAKLLFRTSSQHAATLFQSDNEAVVASLRTLILEVQKIAQPHSPHSPHNAQSHRPSPRRVLHSSTFSEGNNAPKLDVPGLRKNASVDISQKKEEEYKPHLRAKLVTEILDTEKGYVTNLGLVKSIFMVKMTPFIGKWIKSDEFETLFANLGDIVSINTRLYNRLQEKCKETGDDLSFACVGSLFGEEADGLVAYAKYVNNFDNSLKILETLSTRKAAVNFFQGILNDATATGGQLLDLGSYLIMPVQRLPRYELLLRELRKFTPKTHKDSNAIDIALGKMKVVNAKINEMKREEENRVKWNQIKESLTADKMYSPATGELVPGLNKSRWVFHQGSVEVALLKKHKLNKGTQTEKVQRKTKMYLFLFDDMILFTEQKKTKYNIKYYILLDGESVAVAVGEKEDTLSLSNQDIVLGYTYEYIISGESKVWLREISNAINTSSMRS